MIVVSKFKCNQYQLYIHFTLFIIVFIHQFIYLFIYISAISGPSPTCRLQHEHLMTYALSHGTPPYHVAIHIKGTKVQCQL